MMHIASIGRNPIRESAKFLLPLALRAWRGAGTGYSPYCSDPGIEVGSAKKI